MEHKNHNHGREIGIFLIILGLFLAAVMTDTLNLGSFRAYFVWPVLLIFIGVLSLFTKNAAFGILAIATGGYFFLPKIDYDLPVIYEKLYWPTAIILTGLVFIIAGIIKRYR